MLPCEWGPVVGLLRVRMPWGGLLLCYGVPTTRPPPGLLHSTACIQGLELHC